VSRRKAGPASASSGTPGAAAVKACEQPGRTALKRGIPAALVLVWSEFKLAGELRLFGFPGGHRRREISFAGDGRYPGNRRIPGDKDEVISGTPEPDSSYDNLFALLRGAAGEVPEAAQDAVKSLAWLAVVPAEL
jgi:hypothetical protein